LRIEAFLISTLLHRKSKIFVPNFKYFIRKPSSFRYRNYGLQTTNISFDFSQRRREVRGARCEVHVFLVYSIKRRSNSLKTIPNLVFWMRFKITFSMKRNWLQSISFTKKSWDLSIVGKKNDIFQKIGLLLFFLHCNFLWSSLRK